MAGLAETAFARVAISREKAGRRTGWVWRFRMMYLKFAPALLLATAVTGVCLFPANAHAVEWHFKQVNCGKQNLGTMFVNKDTYKSSKVTTNRAGKPVLKENWLGGVTLQAGFAPQPDCKGTYHYLQ